MNVTDKSRRNFLKLILVGSGALFVDKVLGPLFSGFLAEPFNNAKADPPPKTAFKDFKIVESKRVLSIYDSSGTEVLQIDKSNT